ncbi:hypothetical protein BGX24_009656 [Mortierella sp. AD032]|nr:hypothetical protein BGX24_009656 [Mortierella sp. AD032]
MSFDSPEQLTGFARNRHFTRTLETSQASVAKSFATNTACTNLKSLTYQIRGKKSLQFRKEAQTAEVDSLGYSQDVNDVLKAIPASRVEKLEIAFDGPTTYQTRPRINNNHVTGEPHREVFAYLKELVITDSFACQYAEFGFKKLCIERYQAVESLRMENCRELGLSEFLDAVRTSCRILNRLDYFSDGEEDDAVIQQLLTTSRSGCKEVRLSALDSFG